MVACLLTLIIVAALLWWCLYLLAKRFPVLQSIFRRFILIIRWLYKDRREYSGAGKVREPRAKYYDY